MQTNSSPIPDSLPITAYEAANDAAGPLPLETERQCVSRVNKATGRNATKSLLAETRKRYELRAAIARMLRPQNGRGPAVCGCGGAVRNFANVSVYLNEQGHAAVAGVVTCDSWFLCPVCSFKKSLAKRDELVEAAKKCLKGGGAVWLLTLTTRHHLNQPLRLLKETQMKGWKDLQTGRPYMSLCRSTGLLGMVRCTEVLWGPENGWHPHLHALVFFDHRDSEDQKATCNELIARWIRLMEKSGLEADPIGQDARQCQSADAAGDAARYAFKGAAELTGGFAKGSDSGLIHPFVLADRAAAGDEQAVGLWREFALVMPGTKQGVVSPRLAKALDGLIAEVQRGADATPSPAEREMASAVGTVDADHWNWIHTVRATGQLLALVEDACRPDGPGWEAAVAPWIAARTATIPTRREITREHLRRLKRIALPDSKADLPLAA